MKILALPLLASALSGFSALFEKLSVAGLSPITVLTIRYALMLPVLAGALFLTSSHREVASIDGRTALYVALPAGMALGSLLLYFTALKGDLLSRVFPLTELGPAVAMIVAVLLLGEPLSFPRVTGTLLIVAGIILVR